MEPVIHATVYLSNDPTLAVAEKPASMYEAYVQLESARRISALMQQGWVQFFFIKKTTGQETSIIGTTNPELYRYTFKGPKSRRIAGLQRFVAFNRKGRAAWRSFYRAMATNIVEPDKRQAGGREGKNVRVNVDTNTKQTINWDFEKHQEI
jgi:hypothetical protein